MPEPLSRRQFLTLAGAGAASLALPWRRLAGPERRPNILYIVVDDLGYADLGVQGCRDVPTPNVDSIAQNGVRFTDGYVSCPVCSPTRAGLMTGRYQQRFGHEFNPGPEQNASPDFGLPLTEVTLADRLKAAGYATGLVGKWHLGFQPRFHPLERGFDEFFGFLGGAHAYLPGRAGVQGGLLRGRETVEEKEYLTDAFTREAVAFIERRRAEPFFLLLTFNAIHAPMQATDAYLARFPDIQEDPRRTMAAMLSALDDGVGKVLQTLRQAGLEQDTLIIFHSDNGGPTPVNGSRNDPLRGRKGQVYEGGIRVPFLMQWKGHLPAGQVYRQPVIALDVHPTCLAAVGLKGEGALDGVDLLPYLRGERAGPPHERLYWRFGPQAAIRQGRYKLTRLDGTEALYDLEADIGEQENLAEREPEVLADLQRAWAAWEAQLMAPRWSPQARRQTRLRRRQPRR